VDENPHSWESKKSDVNEPRRKGVIYENTWSAKKQNGGKDKEAKGVPQGIIGKGKATARKQLKRANCTAKG